MILSMTGFGRAEDVFEGKKITIDIKSLNSKSFDLNIKIPLRYKEKEFEIRKILNDRIIRGKVDCYVNIENLEESNDVKINKGLIDSYINELKNIASDGPDFEYLKMAVRLPDAITSRPDELTEGEWEALAKIVNAAVDRFEEFRTTEGSNLHEELNRNIQNIDKYLGEVIPFEEERIEIQREKNVLAFRQSVLNAVGEVSDALVSNENLKVQEQKATEQTTTLKDGIKSAQLLYRGGSANYLEVITAQGNSLQAELNLASIKRQRLSSIVDLYRALGGGWK